MKPSFQRIAIKIGSNVLTRTDGTLDVTRMSALVDQIAELYKAGTEIIVVSSGAVASGKSMITPSHTLNDVDQRQLFSAIGQAKLINRYYELFREHGIPVGQVLTVKENFSSPSHYQTQQNCMSVMLENGVIPIVNENDTISLSELMFTDNDELSGQIATMMEVQALVILSNIDGIFNGPPADPRSTVIREIRPADDVSAFIQAGKSTFGRGGMHTKTAIARRIADEGIDVYIANGGTEHILTDLLHAGRDAVCTHFVAARDTVSSVKKWIAHSGGFAKGELHVDDNAARALTGDRAVSLLPVGITRVAGDFEKDDIVKIIDPQGRLLGVGKAQCDSATARLAAGQKNQKPVIHYDYLYIE